MQWRAGTSSAPLCGGDRPPLSVPARSAADRYTCSARAGKPCPSQWQSQQEANFFCCLNSQFSLWASPGAALSLSPRSAASLGLPQSFVLLSRAASDSCLCSHALPLLLGGSFPRCSVWLLPHRRPLFWITFQGTGLLGFQRVGDFFL